MPSRRARVPAILAVLATFVLTSGFTLNSRFDTHLDEAGIGPVIREVRALVTPLFEIRGALFAIRCEWARAGAPPETALVLDRIRGVGLAELGWLATRLHRARSLSPEALNDEVASVAHEVAPEASVSTVAGALRYLVTVDSLRPDSPLPVDSEALTTLGMDAKSRRRIEHALLSIPASAEHLAHRAAEVPSLVKRISHQAERIWADVHRAGDGKAEAIAMLALDGLSIAVVVKPLVEDLSLIPEVVVAIKSDMENIIAALRGVERQIESSVETRPNLAGLTAQKLKILLPELDVDSLRSALKRAFTRRQTARRDGRGCPSPRLTRIDIGLPARKPDGRRWDTPFDEADPKLTCGGMVGGEVHQDSRSASWLMYPRAPTEGPIRCKLVDADVQFDDDIATLVLEVPEAAGPVPIPTVNGVRGTATWTCQ